MKGAIKNILQSLGHPFLLFLRECLELYKITIRTFYFTFKGKREKGSIKREMYEIGNRSLFFITVTMSFIGMIFVYQGGVQAKRIIPDLHLLGATYLEYLVRSLASDIGAMMLATRVGSGIAAMIGTMVVTEQVDALRMCAGEPVDYLVVPKFIASIIMTTVLIIWGGFTAAISGFITAYIAFGQGIEIFFNFSLVRWSDLGIGIIKALSYGASIPIVSAHSGFTAYGGSSGVGWATTKAVVNSSIAIIILNLIISSIGYQLFG